MNGYLSTSVSLDPTMVLIRILLAAAIIFVLFLVFREFLCWYWKLNKIVSLLEKIELNSRPKSEKVVIADTNKVNEK